MEIVEALRAELGATQVLTGPDAARYGRDWMGAYVTTPLCVVRPGGRDEVAAVLRLCHARRVAVVPVSGNTGLVGGTSAEGAVMLSLERLNRIREIRAQARVAMVEAGVVLTSLHEAAAEQGLYFPLWFGARGSAMIGGALSTNAGGSNVLRYGSTRGLVLGLEVVLADGRVLDLMSELHKDNSGYDLRDLFIGAEGTLGVITAAVVKLVPKPAAYATAMVACESLDQALMLLNRLQEATGGMVEAFEYMPRSYMERLAEVRPDLGLPFKRIDDVTLLVELGATAARDCVPGPDGAVPLVAVLETALATMFEAGLLIDAVVARSDAQRRRIWERREAAAEITLGMRPIVDTDVAVPLDKVAVFLARMETRLQGLDPGARALVVAHLGDGNLHYTACPTRDEQALKDSIREAVEDVVLELGGSFSAEHGVGLSKLGSMARRKDALALEIMHSLKAVFDPHGILNPGKVLPVKS
jgi:FAD/FMN-containing dehydrogenase